MKLIIQGIRTKGNKKSVEQSEVILIMLLLAVGILFYETGKEKGTDVVTIKEVVWENAEESFLSTFFPVMTWGRSEMYGNGTELVISKLLSGALPISSYVKAQHSRINAKLTDGYVNKEDEEFLRQSFVIEDVSSDMLALLNQENGFKEASSFEKNLQKVQTVNLAGFETTEEFVKAFYTVDAVTGAKEELFDIELLSEMDMTMKQTNDKPQILIYHTHSQEAFSDSASGNIEHTIVGAGELLKNILAEEYGYNVIHHMGEYDVPSRDYAYSKSLPALEQILAENPTIEVIIDLHRDGVKEGTHLVTDINGVSAAQIMFFNGLSYTKKNGNIGYLKNDNLQENLAFSFQMQKAAKEYYPGLTRKNYLNGYRYNMHLRGKSLLVELGAQTNTVEEIKNAIGPLAHILDIVLSGENT